MSLRFTNFVAVGTFFAWTGRGLSFTLLCFFVVVHTRRSKGGHVRLVKSFEC